jgi:Uma2 family endonuclease
MIVGGGDARGEAPMTSPIAPARAAQITGEELARTPGVGPCELIDGRIVPMSPTSDQHGRIEVKLGSALEAHVAPRRIGKVLAGEVGVYTRRGPDRVRAADVLFISSERYARRSNPPGYLDVAPELIVEILSPGDTVMELTEKLREYFSIGVSLVWVVDPRAQLVYAYRSLTEVREFGQADDVIAEDILPGFRLPVVTLFED